MQHANSDTASFTKRYSINRIVNYEMYSGIRSAIAREKQIKGWLRIRKLALIVSMNPDWKDLSEAWFVRHRYQPDSA